MNKILVTLVFILSLSSISSANENLISIKSSHSVAKTADKFEKIAKSKGMKIFAKINHTKGAKSINEKLRPTQLIIFGNPKAGTPLMQVNQTIGIDLPLKVLFWQDKNNETWISYYKPKSIIASHNITNKEKIANKMTNILKTFTQKAAN